MNILTCCLVVSMTLIASVTCEDWQRVFEKNSKLTMEPEVTLRLLESLEEPPIDIKKLNGLAWDDVTFMIRANTITDLKCNFYYLKDMNNAVQKWKMEKMFHLSHYLKDCNDRQLSLCVSTIESQLCDSTSTAKGNTGVQNLVSLLDKKGSIAEGLLSYLNDVAPPTKPSILSLKKTPSKRFKENFDQEIIELCRNLTNQLEQPLSILEALDENHINYQLSLRAKDVLKTAKRCDDIRENKDEYLLRTYQLLKSQNSLFS